MLRRAALSALWGMPLYHHSEGGEGGGGAQPAKKEPEQPADDKVTLTKAELEQQRKDAIAEALKAERDAQAKQRQKDEDERQRKEQEQQGQFKELADKEREKREKAEEERDGLKRELRRKDVESEIRAYLRESHAGYDGSEIDILPHIQFDLDTDAKEVTKRIKDAADAFVKRNPRNTKGASGAPLPPSSGGGTRQPQNGKQPVRTGAHSVAMSRF
jgi:hypothetical protein